MGKLKSLTACFLLTFCSPALTADPFVGRFVGDYEGEEYRLTLESAGTYRYEGEIVIDGEPVPLVARRFGERLSGEVGIGGDGFEFTAEFSGDVLLLHDANGEVIRFQTADP
jgi:hypothetical protein